MRSFNKPLTLVPRFGIEGAGSMGGKNGQIFGGVEAGGTKIVCAVAADPEEPFERERFATGEPRETLAAVGAFFREARERFGSLAALGVGTFGPAGVGPGAENFGRILTTPKEGWSGFDFLGTLRSELGEAALPIAFETDVNAAAVGEAVYGAARGFAQVAYVTIGTGIGGGLLVNGTPMHGRMHPEIGHLLVPGREGAREDSLRGACPFHEDCFEGRASGTAMTKRWGVPGAELGPDHEAWALEAEYLAMGVVNLTAAWSPEIVILGGGVSQAEGLVEAVRERFAVLAGSYWNLPPIEEYIVTPALGQDAGIVGALVLAERAFVR